MNFDAEHLCRVLTYSFNFNVKISIVPKFRSVDDCFIHYVELSAPPVGIDPNVLRENFYVADDE